MSNRYASIVRNLVADMSDQMLKLLAKTPEVDSWIAEEGKLVAVIKGEKFDMDFENGDPLTDTLLMFLNNSRLFLSALKEQGQ